MKYLIILLIPLIFSCVNSPEEDSGIPETELARLTGWELRAGDRLYMSDMLKLKCLNRLGWLYQKKVVGYCLNVNTGEIVHYRVKE